MADFPPTEIETRYGFKVLLRSARPADAARVIAYTRVVLSESHGMVTQAHEFNTSVGEEQEYIKSHLNHGGRLFLLAEHQRELAGALHFSNGGRERNQHVGSLGISVGAAWRRRGIGEALMRALIDWARANPLIEKLGLAVFADNQPAIELYRKLGFEIEGRRLREYKLGPGRYADDLLMFLWVK